MFKQTKTNIMIQVTTTQKTFGKATIKQIKKLYPDALTSKKINKDFVIRNAKGICVCTWHKQSFANGLIVIH